MNNFKRISPFKCMCVSIGNLPSAYSESMSYYECLTYLVKYLENEIIPAINNNSQAVEELQIKLKELDEYVKNYFENLDVQEEINNKLDEMADEGTLQEIIATYLNTNAIFGFDNTDDLKAGSNLLDGSFAKTLGDKNINDGNGELYKISDTDDGEGILLNNGLYANPVKNPKSPNFFVSAFFQSNSPYKDDFYVSLDGINVSKLNVPFELQGRDICLRYNPVNKMFYITTGALDLTNYDFTIYYSSDFKTWNYEQVNIGLTGNLKWAPDLFIDDDGTMRLLISNNYGMEDDITGENNPAFDLYYTYCTDLDNLTFVSATKVVLSGYTHRNHIDGSLAKINDTYYMICKDDYSKVNEIYLTNDFINYSIVNNNVTGGTMFVEGCQLLQVGNYVYYLADANRRNRQIISKTPLSTFPVFEKFNIIEGVKDHRHGSMIYVDNEYAKNLIKKACSEFNLDGNNEIINPLHNLISLTSGVDDYLKTGLVVIPNTVYYATSGEIELDLVNSFDLDYFKFYFAGNNSMKLTIKSINGVNLSPALVINNSRFINEKMIEIPINDNSKLYTLNGNYDILSDSDLTLTRPTDFDIVWFNAYKVNGVVNLSFRITCKTNTYGSGETFTFTTLPVSWRPARTMYLTPSLSTDNRAELSSSGELTTHIQLNENDSIGFTLTYIGIN